MKFIIIFVSLLVSCSTIEFHRPQHAFLQKNNSLYIRRLNSDQYVEVARGTEAIRYFKRNVDFNDTKMLNDIIEYYKQGTLDSLDMIWYNKHLFGGEKWSF